MNHITEFRDAIASAGLPPPDDILDDGKIHRFSTSGKKRDDAGWYILHGDGIPAGKFGCNRSSLEVTWRQDIQRDLTPAERQANRARIEASRAAKEAETAAARAAAAEQAGRRWGNAKPDDQHPYLVRKGIPGLGARVLNGELLVPVRHSPTELVGLQRIRDNGGKFFLKDTPAAGGYHAIGKPGPVFAIGEGYATCVSGHLATGWPVVIAFNSGNLLAVARKIRARFPDITIVILADDDAWTVYPANHERAGQPWNPGMEAAHEAAAAVGGAVAVPRWYGDREQGATDFNDLHLSEGLHAVRECIEMALDTPPPAPTDTETRTGAPQTRPASTAETVKPASDGAAHQAVNNTGSSGPGISFHPVDAAVVELPVVLGAPTPDYGPPAGSDVLPDYHHVSDPGEIPDYYGARDRAAAWGLEANDKRQPHATVANVVRALMQDPKLAGLIWFDDFLERTMTAWRRKEPGEWSDVDDINLQAYLQTLLDMPKLGKATVQDAVNLVAHRDQRNEARAYLQGLRWDGIERLAAFFPDCFGTEDTEYTRAASRNFWISLAARVLKPGCKVDTMIVLEGIQGAGKSRALSIIGGQWFAEAIQSPTEKDFYLNLAGKMLIEIGEMDAFSRSEVTKVKQVITCQTDRYRAPYERRAADHPRRCVFAGTTNRDDWNRDETGARRFWPVLCLDIRHDTIVAQRDQLFAEAVAAVNAGASWWDMPTETENEQERRRDSDELEAQLSNYLTTRNTVTTIEVMNDFMKVPFERQDKALQMRIGKALRSIKWQRVVAWSGDKVVRKWRRQGNTQDDRGGVGGEENIL